MTTESPTASTKRRRLRLSGRKWLWLSVAVVVLIAGGVGAYLLMRPGRTNQAQAITRTVRATLGTQTRTVTVDGTLSPRKQSDVNFAVSGTITRVYVKAGDKVTKNQKLARVDDTELVNAVDLARANLTTAQANYTEVVDNDGSSAAIASANAQVRSARGVPDQRAAESERGGAAFADRRHRGSSHRRGGRQRLRQLGVHLLVEPLHHRQLQLVDLVQQLQLGRHRPVQRHLDRQLEAGRVGRQRRPGQSQARPGGPSHAVRGI